jgi:hypothetical protein
VRIKLSTLFGLLVVVVIFMTNGLLKVSESFPAQPPHDELLLPTSTGKMTRPAPGMSADELMKVFFHVKFSKDSSDYKALGGTRLISKKGLKRNRTFQRFRIILNRPSDDLDYKDIVTFTSPQNVKGFTVLSWTYLTLGRDQDVWLWLPSLRKIRRVSQSEADDSFMGSDFTYEEAVSRKWGDETYTLVGEENFSGQKSMHNGKTYYKDTPCYMIEARPKREDWYYMKRKVYLEKSTAFRIYDTYFDKMGRSQKTLFVYWESIGGSELEMEWLLEVSDLRSDHSTIIDLEEVQFDQGQPENFFTERTLMRTKW